MFAPAPDVATEPSRDAASAARRVVVVLPFVPLTRRVFLPRVRWASSCGSTSWPTRPPTVDPDPRRRCRESEAVSRTRLVAREVRHDLSLLPVRGGGETSLG
jgi:hypothetical protein